jgi:subtilisin family serine protease
MKKYGILLCLACAVGVVIFTNEPLQIPRDAIAPRPAVTQKSPGLSSEDRSSQPPTKAPSREIAELVPLLNAPISMRASGVPQKFELAADELYLRLPDGSQRVLAIPKATTPAAFAAAIEKARTEHGIEPELVLYPVGAPRNEYSRRIVTRDVAVKAASKSEADAVAATGGLVFQKALYFAPDAFVYKAPTSLQALTAQLDAEAVNLAAVSTQLARKAATMSMPNDPYVQLQWHLKNTGQRLREPGGVSYTAAPEIDINVESVWNYPESNSGNYTRGQGVVIGIVDDSLQWNHPDLKANVIRDLQWDWNQSDNDPSPYYWSDAHGTACAGVAAAKGNNRLGVSGVAPEASLVGMRLISGPSTDLDEAEAMAWNSDQIDIKSNSWGYPSVYDGGFYFLRKNGELANAAIKHAIAHGRDGKGTIFTFSAGNSFLYNNGVADVPSGARVEFKDYQGSMYTIAVGAIDSSGKKSYYSQIGSALVVSAPSNGEIGIMTTDRTGYYGYNDIVSGKGGTDIRNSGDYSKTFGGTSSACPAVSGVIALMLQKNPDLGWRDVQEILIRSANRTFDAAGWETNGAGIPFNYNYGAGMVDAAAAVAMADGWTNIKAQKNSKVTNADSLDLNSGTTITRDFEIPDALRAEHVTLKLSTPGVKKGDLRIKLKSPPGMEMESVFCEPHDDKQNELNEWIFMSVRHWGEDSQGTWTLTIENTGGDNGTLEDTELIVYGTPIGGSQNPPPVVSGRVSTKRTFVGSSFHVTGTGIDQNEDSTKGTIGEWEVILFNDDDSTSQSFSRTSSNGSETWEITPNKAGNYTLTINATDAEDAVGNSDPITIRVYEAPIAAWDFDSLTTQSPQRLAAVLPSIRKYAANFGSGNLIFDGSFSSETNPNPNKWDYSWGQLYHDGQGDSLNSVGDMEDSENTNIGLLVRGGKWKAAEGKWMVFEISMENYKKLNVSYIAREDSGGHTNGFAQHTWSWSVDGENWNDETTLAVPNGIFDTLNVPEIDDIELNGAAKVYLKIQFSGLADAAGFNIIDNIIISAEPIVPDIPASNFTDVSPSKLDVKEKSKTVKTNGAGSQNGTASNAEGNQAIMETELDWVTPEDGAYSMFVYAEVVDRAKFLNAPGSLLSAAKDNKILGLAEPLPQTTRYDLAISSPEARPAPLRVRLYDANRQAVLVMEEAMEFESGATVGSPSMPVRYNVAYEELEQRIPVVQGWNSFTVALEPLPATLNSILADYEAAEGDQLVGPTSEATYLDGAWEPAGFSLQSGASYSLWRQSLEPASVTLRGKALESIKSHSALPVQAPVRQQSVGSSGSASMGPSAAHAGNNSEKKAAKKAKKSDKKRGSKSKRKSDS